MQPLGPQTMGSAFALLILQDYNVEPCEWV